MNKTQPGLFSAIETLSRTQSIVVILRKNAPILLQILDKLFCGRSPEQVTFLIMS
jgi:hypothetical protein